ncbi:MAG: hypothetical protein CML12_00470 [Puniceicoccaceae bacterium]|nr:hypothetical protein [Puniceicoccaceae bacterium]|tara:strand:+ start:97 stop:729 length:633 start_codon:yes stop_codon:yes gene_type:complete
MNTLIIRPKNTFFKTSFKRKEVAFTIVELLVVLAVIVILAGITFGTATGVQTARMKATARAEIMLISQSLERFHSIYGDYPITAGPEDNAITLSKALLGWKEFKGKPLKFVDRSPRSKLKVEALIDPTKVRYEGDVPEDIKRKPVNVRFTDPWGQPYVYAYKDSKEWNNYAFVLYSKGPDGVAELLPTDGVYNQNYKNLETNIDNINIQD